MGLDPRLNTIFVKNVLAFQFPALVACLENVEADDTAFLSKR